MSVTYPQDTYGPCPKCGRSGRDIPESERLRASGQLSDGEYVRCTYCNGEGIEPYERFEAVRNLSRRQQ